MKFLINKTNLLFDLNVYFAHFLSKGNKKQSDSNYKSFHGTFTMIFSYHQASANLFSIPGAYNVGLQHLIAGNEDEYVQLALKLASDITALQNLRTSLRDLMSKSPVCDGQNFISGLEATYRNMWRRYCKGDVPSLRYMEKLQKQDMPDELTTKTSDPEKITVLGDTFPSTVKCNGFNQVPLPVLNLTTSEESGNQSNQTTNSSKPS